MNAADKCSIPLAGAPVLLEMDALAFFLAGLVRSKSVLDATTRNDPVLAGNGS